jgi:hypothetical protein
VSDQSIIALAAIVSGAIVTPFMTALFARRTFGIQRKAEQESTDLVEARRIVMDYVATVAEFRDSVRAYTRAIERSFEAEKTDDELIFARQQLENRVEELDVAAPTFWSMVGPESGIAEAHRDLIERGQSMARLAVSIRGDRFITAEYLEEWRLEAERMSFEFSRFAAAVGAMVGFRLPGASRC